MDSFGFEYEFASSTDYYFSGKFDDALIRVLECYDNIQKIMLPSLRDERRETYSPFLPVDPDTHEVYQVPVLHTDPKNGTIVYRPGDTFEPLARNRLAGDDTDFNASPAVSDGKLYLRSDQALYCVGGESGRRR